MIIHRRNFLIGGLVSLFAAPAIVRASSLMPIKAIIIPANVGSVTFSTINNGGIPFSRNISIMGLDTLDGRCGCLTVYGTDALGSPITENIFSLGNGQS